METLDETLIQTTPQQDVKYGGFWKRLGAMLVDAVILAPLSFGVTYFNIISWKSMPVLILVSLLGMAYKPLLEFLYGATLGKMALRLKVVNVQLGKASLGEIMLRNAFYIVPALFTLYFTLDLYQDPDFEDITGFMEYSVYSAKFKTLQYINYCMSFITIVDGIVMLADKNSRSLHDKIAQTSVIDQDR